MTVSRQHTALSLRLMKDVYKLVGKGIKPTGSETLESFVEKHKDLLEGEE